MTLPSDQVAIPVRTANAVFATGALIIILSRIFGRGLYIITNVFIARSLGSSVFGLYALGWTIIQVIATVGPLGLDKGVIYFGAKYWQQNRTELYRVVGYSLALALFLGVTFAVLLIGFAELVAHNILREPDIASLLPIFALAFPAVVLLKVAASATRISRQMIYSAIAHDLTQPLVYIVLFLNIFLISDISLRYAAIALSISFFAACAMGVYYIARLMHRHPVVQAQLETFEPWALVRYSGPTAFIALSTILLLRLDRFVVGYFYTASDVGLYEAASQLPLILPLLLTGISFVFAPEFAQLYEQKDFERINELYKMNTRWSVYIGLVPFLVMIVAAEQILLFMFGSDYTASSEIMVALTVGQFINISTGSVSFLLLMTNQQKVLAGLSISSLILNFFLSIVLASQLGPIGAALASALSVTFQFSLSVGFAYRIYGLFPYTRDYLQIGGVAVVGFVVLSGVQQLLVLPLLLELLVLSITAVVVLWGALYFVGLKPEDRAFIDKAMQRVLSPRSNAEKR